MYVFVDMEWISNQRGDRWPTQLAAARVDAQWNTVDTFSMLFRPKDFSFQQWGHMAFSGWNREQFLNGESPYAGFDAFRHWLQPEDTICWWHQEQAACSISSPRYPAFLINLVSQPENTKRYHVQPRLFLSLKDTFDYIMRHDNALMKRIEGAGQEAQL